MTGGGKDWGSKKRGSMKGIYFLGLSLSQQINMMEFVLGKSVGREVDECGFWCVMLVHTWWVPCCHSSGDCDISEPNRFPGTRSAPSLPPLLPRSPYDFCHDVLMVEVGCGPAHSPVPQVAGHSPCPRNMVQLRGEHTDTFSPPLSHCSSLSFSSLPCLSVLHLYRPLQSSHLDLR